MKLESNFRVLCNVEAGLKMYSLIVTEQYVL